MKLLNSASLQRLAKEPSYPISMEGQMNFRRSNDEKFQKRYFLLKGNLLFYFAKKSDKAPIGLIILEGYTVELSNEHDGYCFQLLRRSNGNVAAALTFVVGTAESLQNWLSALTNCSYEQLKMSAERMAELATPNGDHKTGDTVTPRDENDNQLSGRQSENAEAESTNSKASFEELHETYGHKIQEILSASKV